MDAANDHAEPEGGEDHDGHPARTLTLHLLRMLETRADAAGIALQSEVQSLSTRLQLGVLAVAALFIAIWGGIVLLAIALPPDFRVPVLSSVVLVFVIGGVWALLVAKRKITSRDIGSMTWFLESLRLDLEVLSRALVHTRTAAPPAEEERRAPDDLAA